MASQYGKLSFVLLINAVLLFLAIVPLWPYSFYMALRLVVFGTSIYVALLLRKMMSWRFKLQVMPILAIVILFNPVFVVHLSRLLWLPIDVTVALYFLWLRKRLGEVGR